MVQPPKYFSYEGCLRWCSLSLKLSVLCKLFRTNWMEKWRILIQRVIILNLFISQETNKEGPFSIWSNFLLTWVCCAEEFKLRYVMWPEFEIFVWTFCANSCFLQLQVSESVKVQPKYILTFRIYVHTKQTKHNFQIFSCTRINEELNKRYLKQWMAKDKEFIAKARLNSKFVTVGKSIHFHGCLLRFL